MASRSSAALGGTDADDNARRKTRPDHIPVRDPVGESADAARADHIPRRIRRAGGRIYRSAAGDQRGFNITQGPDQGLNATSIEQFRGGFNIGGRAGFQLGPLRLEGEVNYRDKNLGRGVQMISPVNRVGRGQNAERHSVSEMANLIYDLDLGLPVSPHIGGGIGAAEVTRNLSNIFGGTHDTVTVFAYQGMAGLRYWLSPAFAVDLDYRYFATTETTFLSTNVGGDRIHSEYRTHNVIASVVYRFAPTQP